MQTALYTGKMFLSTGSFIQWPSVLKVSFWFWQMITATVKKPALSGDETRSNCLCLPMSSSLCKVCLNHSDTNSSWTLMETERVTLYNPVVDRWYQPQKLMDYELPWNTLPLFTEESQWIPCVWDELFYITICGTKMWDNDLALTLRLTFASCWYSNEPTAS